MLCTPPPPRADRARPTDESTPVERRAAVLVSQTLQNMANQLRFRGLESYLEPLNVFIEDHEPELDSFFRAVMV